VAASAKGMKREPMRIHAFITSWLTRFIFVGISPDDDGFDYVSKQSLGMTSNAGPVGRS
jgi:hypothetical protein